MATTRRRKSLAVIEQLTREPYRFDFFQAVRLLELATAQSVSQEHYISHQPVARWVRPNKELVHFVSSPSLAFKSADVQHIELLDNAEYEDADPELQWRMTVNFMGLTGSQGVLPYFFSELLLRQARANNRELEEFLNIFDHRALSLFYQAGTKYRLPLHYERRHTRKKKKLGLFSHTLAALVGLGTDHVRDQLQIPDEVIYGFGGLLAREVRSAAGLKGIIKHYFGLEVTINQFAPQWQELPGDVVTRLPSQTHPGSNNVLGVNTLLGVKCKNIQSKFTVNIEPPNYEDFMTLAPGSTKMVALQSVIQYYAGNDLDYEVCVNMPDSVMPAARLHAEEPTRLGWNSPIYSDLPGEGTIEIKVSGSSSDNDEMLEAI